MEKELNSIMDIKDMKVNFKMEKEMDLEFFIIINQLKYMKAI